jgi:outer membrane biosynthesis protein TonB
LNTRRTYIITITASILLHLLLLLLYHPAKLLTKIVNLADAAPVVPVEQQFEPIEFELVETPDDAQTAEPPANPQAYSDKNARAQDMYEDNNLEQGLPFSLGQTDYKVFAGGGQQEAFQMPNPADEEPQEGEEQSQEKQQNQEEEHVTAGDVQIFSQARLPQKRQRFSKEMLRGNSQSNANSQGQFLDDSNWNNDKFSAEALGGVSLSTYAWDFAPYIFYMKRRLRDHIYPPAAFYKMGMINGEVVLRFKLHLDGSTSDLQLLSYEGHKALTETSLNAVKASSPFKQLPENFPENYLELTWTFIYSIFR